MQSGLKHHPEHAELAEMLAKLEITKKGSDKENKSDFTQADKSKVHRACATSDDSQSPEDKLPLSAEEKVAALKSLMMGLGGNQ